MTNIPLGDIKGEYLFGEWHVENRFSTSKDTTNIFSKNKRLILRESSFQAINNGLPASGTWKMQKKTGGIYNPQLTFYIDREEIAEAIITRLMITDKYDNRSEYILTLYFSNGLELILTKGL